MLNNVIIIVYGIPYIIIDIFFDAFLKKIDIKNVFKIYKFNKNENIKIYW